jgi:hypothetical protein
MSIARRIGLGLLATIVWETPAMTSAATDVAPNVVDFAKLKETAGLDLGTPEGMTYMKSNKKALEAAIRCRPGRPSLSNSLWGSAPTECRRTCSSDPKTRSALASEKSLRPTSSGHRRGCHSTSTSTWVLENEGRRWAHGLVARYA